VTDDQLYLEYIRDAIDSIQQFVSEGEDSFRNSDLIQSAVLYKLQTLAESTQNLSDSVRSKYPSVDWIGIRGFRNRLVHGYLGINIEVVWSIIVNDLPGLKEAIRQEFNTRESPET